MCTRPITRDQNTFACRNCDACIATRRSGWIARAMAEKADWPYTLCVALTYSDETEENRDAAAMFAYDDIRAFLKRLLSHCNRVSPGARVRFICAGEQGDRNGRCHWHLILYSDLDLTTIGVFSRFGKTVTKPEHMLTVGKRKIRLNWSTWGKGFVTLQEPDEGGMAYVLSYCLKDQFTHEKSEGTMRQAKVENFATGLFRMSKRPAIGEAWLYRKLETLLDLGAVLPSLNIKVPDMSGYWNPSGSFRKKLLWGLVALNQRHIWATGANAPQWSSLLSACADNESDYEVLNVYQKEKTEKIDYTERARNIGRRLENLADSRQVAIGFCHCQACLDASSDQGLEARALSRLPAIGGVSQYLQDGKTVFCPPFRVWIGCKFQPQGPDFSSVLDAIKRREVAAKKAFREGGTYEDYLQASPHTDRR